MAKAAVELTWKLYIQIIHENLILQGFLMLFFLFSSKVLFHSFGSPLFLLLVDIGKMRKKKARNLKLQCLWIARNSQKLGLFYEGVETTPFF